MSYNENSPLLKPFSFRDCIVFFNFFQGIVSSATDTNGVMVSRHILPATNLAFRKTRVKINPMDGLVLI